MSHFCTHFFDPILAIFPTFLAVFLKSRVLKRGQKGSKMTVFRSFLGRFLTPFFDTLWALIRRFYLILLTSRCLKKGSKKGSKIDPLLGYPPKMQTKAPTGKFLSFPDDKIHVRFWSIWVTQNGTQKSSKIVQMAIDQLGLSTLWLKI